MRRELLADDFFLFLCSRLKSLSGTIADVRNFLRDAVRFHAIKLVRSCPQAFGAPRCLLFRGYLAQCLVGVRGRQRRRAKKRDILHAQVLDERFRRRKRRRWYFHSYLPKKCHRTEGWHDCISAFLQCQKRRRVAPAVATPRPFMDISPRPERWEAQPLPLRGMCILY